MNPVSPLVRRTVCREERLLGVQEFPSEGQIKRWEKHLFSNVFCIIFERKPRMKPFQIIVAEDDKWYAEFLQYQLSLNPDYQVTSVHSARELFKQLTPQTNAITLDYSLPDATGAEVLRRIRTDFPTCQVVVVSGQEDIKTAVSLLKEGAYDYIVKDEDTKDRLWKTIVNIRENLSLRKEVEALREEVGHKYNFSLTIVGQSKPIQKVFGLLEKAAQSSINVSISGETGTGKEVVAKAIHYHSDRRKSPFVAINVSAIPHELIESELFGHEKGAFTGAATRRIGKFEEAGKGTLFLDEIAEMEPGMQSKLLRVLQERELVRVGGNSTIPIECRIISASHRNLSDEVSKGNFRQDLYYRLMGLPIELPPLRDRKEDIILLARHFVDEYARLNKVGARKISDEAMDKLLNYSFPGNIRELKAIMDLAMVLADENEIEGTAIRFYQSDVLRDLDMTEMTLEAYNQKIVRHYLQKYNDNVLQVSKILDIGKSTIYRMLKEKV